MVARKLQAKLFCALLCLSITAQAAEIIRDQHGRIARSYEAKKLFKLEHPCPANGNRFGPCKGYVIDHVRPLACGGADDPSNLQWQTVKDAKAKDKWERIGC